MKNLEIKKMSLTNIESKLTPAEMESIMAGSGSSGGNCSTVTGGLCAATIILCYTGPFACLAGATGIGCALGLYAC